MNFRLSSIKAVAASLVALTVSTIPQIAQASTAQEDAYKAQIATLKQQIYLCHHHKRHHRRAAACPISSVTERNTVVEKPVIIERERIVEKEVEAPTVEVSKSVVVEQQMDEQRLVVEHSKHRKHLFHVGIPFIGVNLF